MKTILRTLPVTILQSLVLPLALAQSPAANDLYSFSSGWRTNSHSELDLISLLRCDDTHWSPRPRIEGPESLGGYAMTYDSGRGVTVLFLGIEILGLGVLSETWEWDGTNWALRDTDTIPKRLGAELAYDAARGVTILFGGQAVAVDDQTPVEVFSDVWAWDGNSWTDKAPVEDTPGPRVGHAMVYDVSEECIVMFGGQSTNLFLLTPSLQDTWAWNGTAWEALTPATSPTARSLHEIVYDTARNCAVLFGGREGTTVLGDTWEWDGNNWTQATPVTSPPSRRAHGMAFNAESGSTILFGGELGQVFAQDTWTWDGNNWTEIHPGNAPESTAWEMSHDTARGETLLFLLEDLWVFEDEAACGDQ